MKTGTFKFLLTATILTHLFFDAASQDTLTQNLRGVVIDAISHSPVENVNVVVPGKSQHGTSTNEDGYFLIDDLEVGRYDLRLSHVSYKPKIIRDLLIEAGKEEVIQIQLTPTSKILEDVEIESGRAQNQDFLQSNAYVFNMEQSQRFAATFYDPGRMATSLPGVTMANDQANNISIRGNAPAGLTWRLEGADIVNPNHLTNAGTFSDRPSVAGGGVNILSAQLMEQSTLYNGAFPANIGNALSGAMDIQLRDGNRANHEYTIQAGLLGIDLAAEGPLSKNNDASFLVNYRYSTIGLLTALGVDLGEEAINFQDLSFKVNLPTEKAGEFTVFGMGGLSSEKFNAVRDSSEWESDEDRYDTDFSSDMGAIGAGHTISLSDKSSLESKVVFSSITSERTGEYITASYDPQLLQYDAYSQSLLSAGTHLSHKIKKNSSLKAGIYYNQMFYDIQSQVKRLEGEALDTVTEGSGDFKIIKPYVSYSFFLTGKLKTTIGLHNQYVTINNEFSPEPRIGMAYFVSPKTTLELNYGLVSQTQIPHVYFVMDENNTFPNKDLQLTKSHQVVATLSTGITKNTDLKVEVYYQHHYDVPVSPESSGTYSILNATDAFINRALVNKGIGDNLGLDIAVNRYFSNGYYFLTGGSIYDAKYTAADNNTRNTRFNGNYQFTFTGGKEITTIKNDKNRVFGINTRVIWQGGYWHTPIDTQASAAIGRTVYDESLAFSEQLKDYGRIDLRIYFKRHRKNYTRTLSLDIQNVTGRKNVAYKYYDVQAGKVITKEQLGLLPFLNYRIEF